MASPWYFVLPADRTLPSGGNRYNEQLIRALQQVHQAVEIIDFRTYQHARSAGQSGCFFVDSLFVKELVSLAEPSPQNQRTVFIVHHLESMDMSPVRTKQQCQAEERTAFAHVDTFLATSPFSERYLREQGVDQSIIVIEPGVAAPTLPRGRHAEGVNALMVANLIARKGILPWLQSLTTVLKSTDAFVLTIVGRDDLEPRYAKECRRFVAQHPLLRSKVHFTGALPHRRVEEHYARTRLFVSAARMETFGMALQEAKAYRVPLLTLTGGYAGQHVASEHDGRVFETLAEMADFFVNLVRNPAELVDWQAATVAQPPNIQYGWDTAAQQLIRQLDQ